MSDLYQPPIPSGSINPPPWGEPITAAHDQFNIDTPEQVQIRFAIAGLGSRFLAFLIDCLIQTSAYLLLFLFFILIVSAAVRDAAGQLTGASEKWFIAGVIFVHFLLYWGYFALFEGLWRGQTPGKRFMKLRVIKDSGRQITLFEAMARNLLRVIDALPGMYLAGAVSILVSRQNKRIGDFLADTIVVHERDDQAAPSVHLNRSITAGMVQPAVYDTLQQASTMQLPADAIARLSAADLNVIETFLARNLDLELDVRSSLAGKLLLKLQQKCGLEAHPSVNPERVLEAMAQAIRAQGRIR